MSNPTLQQATPPAVEDDCALFLDFDGTLVDIAERPEQVRLLPAVRESIARISDRLQGAVALVSGRPLAQLDDLFAPLRLAGAGLHGHQIRSEANARAEMPDAPAEFLHALHQRAMQLAHAHPGVLIEDKGISLALHWRSAPAAAESVQAFALSELPRLPGYRLQAGDHGIEFVPAGSDKGRALAQLMQRPPFQGRRPVFVGDDLTDEHGFAQAHQLGGWSVLVGNRKGSQARYWLANPSAVHAWLQANARGDV